MLRYSNGWGHFLISVIFLIAGLVLIFFSADSTTKGIGVGLVTTVCGAWFVPGAAKQMANEIINHQNMSSAPPPAAPAPEPLDTAVMPA